MSYVQRLGRWESVGGNGWSGVVRKEMCVELHDCGGDTICGGYKILISQLI